MAGAYYEQVVQALRGSDALRRLGFRGEDINWYGSGRDHHDLMVVSKLEWTVRRREGQPAMYEGINVHFESRRPGTLQLDCELTPRLGSEAAADQRIIAPLLQLKGTITTALRAALLRPLASFGANLRRVRENPADPASLKVMGFDLDLAEDHRPVKYVAAVEPLIQAASPLIDQVLSRGQWDDSVAGRSPGPAMPGALISPDGCVAPPISGPLLSRIQRIRGMPERNMEDAVKRLLMELGHAEDDIHFQVGRIDVGVQNADGTAFMVIETKRELAPSNLPAAVEQAMGYAVKNGAALVVVTDADRYEVYDRSRGAELSSQFVGRFQLTRYHRSNDAILDLLRPLTLRCDQCGTATPRVGSYCRWCGAELHRT